MTRPLPEPSPAALAKALARQKADLERFPEGAVVRIVEGQTLFQPGRAMSWTAANTPPERSTLLDVAHLRRGELWVIAKAEPGQVTLVNPLDGRQVVAGQDTLKQCAEVVT